MNRRQTSKKQSEVVKSSETRPSWIHPTLSELDVNLTKGPGGSGADGFSGS